MINLLKKFKGKKIIITGHTGFKGSWLTLWLTYLGANVTGISNIIPTKLDDILEHDLWLDSKKCLQYNLVDELWK